MVDIEESENKNVSHQEETNAIWVHLSAENLPHAGFLCQNGFRIHHGHDQELPLQMDVLQVHANPSLFPLRHRLWGRHHPLRQVAADSLEKWGQKELVRASRGPGRLG